VKRLLFNLLSRISLILFALAVALWVRSYMGDGGGWVWNISGERCHLGMSKGSMSADLLPQHHTKTWNSSLHNGLGMTLMDGTVGGQRFVMFLTPIWLPTLAFVVLPIVRFATRRLRRSLAEGHCRACGYDLRATPDRCPECGTVPKNPVQAKV
jgi:hypothetical protein